MARRRGPTRWIVLVFVLIGAAWGLYYLFARLAAAGPDLAASQFVLPALSMLLVVLFLALAGVLIRNLVRLIVDRKRGILGARLRTKLVFFFLALVLVPALVLFSGAAKVIKETVEAILRTPLEELTREADEVVRAYFEVESERQARAIGEEVVGTGLLAPGRNAELERLLGRWQREHQLDLVQVTREGRVLARAASGGPVDSGEELQAQVDALVADVARTRRPAGRINRLPTGLMAHAAFPVYGPGDDAAPAIVAVGFALPSRLADNLEGFHGAAQAYRQFRANRKDLVRLYLTQIALILLVTVFLATWLGFYLARRITEPIQEIAAASREISAGNLNVRVRAQAGDEVGMLIEAFNEMAGELEESRAVITRSTADLRRSNRALNERRRYIETLLANLTTAVVSMDPLGRVTTANPAAGSILGVELSIGDDAQAVFRRVGLEGLADLLAQHAADGEDLRRDLTLDYKGGPLHVAVQLSPLRGAAGENVGRLLMVEDLTDLLQAQRASAWREVAQRIAHEIKNPLTPIQLAAQRLRKKFAEGSPDLERIVPEATAVIEREVGGLKQLVDEFSRFARMPELAPRTVDFREVIDSVLALYEGHTEIDWQLDLDPRVGEVVLDPQQMRRALINLIDNAMAALGGAGKVTVCARPVTDELLRIEVADSGPGIPPADRDKMFVPYFSTKKRGTGLGLAIVHRVITDHRGTIRVEDNEPHGARFVIEIPA